MTKTIHCYLHCAEILPISEKDVVYFQPKDKHETIAESKKVLKDYRFKHELKITFLFNFLRKTEEVETLGKNGGASSHTRHLQETI